MNNKKKIILISISIVLVIVLLILLFLLIDLSKKKEVNTNNETDEFILGEQINSFQDVKLIEELLKSGKILDDSIGKELDDSQKDILKNLGVSDNLIDTYRVYTSEDLLNSNFISVETEGEHQVEDWKSNYANEKYIISQSQELAFLVNGRKDEKGRTQYARLVDDDDLYEELNEKLNEEETTNIEKEVSEDEVKTVENETTVETNINIRKVERLKYNVSIDYPENAVERKYAIKINDETSSSEDGIGLNTLQENINATINEGENAEGTSETMQSTNLDVTTSENSDGEIVEQNQIDLETIVEENQNQKYEVDYDSLEWIDYDGTIFIEENVTIYTKYKLDKTDDDYTIGNFREVPELILSVPTYEIVEDETSMYVKFSNSESEYNNEVKFQISYGKKETEEEPIYTQWQEAIEDKFNIEEVGKYYIKVIAVMPNKNVTDSSQMKISIGRLENQENTENTNSPENTDGTSNTIVDTTQQEIVSSVNTKLRNIKLNGVYLSQNIIDSLNSNGTYEYKVSSANSVVIRASAQDSNATVIGDGIYNFKNNKSTIKVQIVANDGTRSVYTIIVTRYSAQSGNSSSSSTNSNSDANSENTSNNNSGGTSQGSSNNSNDSNSSGGNTSTSAVCNHNWQVATCVTPKKCTKCGATEGDKNASNHSNYGTTSKVTTEATCTTPQVTTNYCNGCGKEVSTTKGKTLEHSYTVKTTTNAYLKSSATCTTPATYYYACKCGAKGTATYTDGSTLAHSYTVKTTTNAYLKSSATCATPATYYYACKCGAKGTVTYTSGSKNSSNHSNYGTWSKVTTTATCTRAKVTTNYCNGCNAVVSTTTGSKAAHTPSKWTKDTKNNEHYKYCTTCKTTTNSDKHTCKYGCGYGTTTTICPPNSSSSTHTCKICGESFKHY